MYNEYNKIPDTQFITCFAFGCDMYFPNREMMEEHMRLMHPKLTRQQNDKIENLRTDVKELKFKIERFDNTISDLKSEIKEEITNFKKGIKNYN